LVVIIKDRKLKKIFDNEDTKLIKKQYGQIRAEKIYQRYNELINIDNFYQLLSLKIGRCHALEGKYQGCYGLDLDHPFRMIIKPKFADNNQSNLIEVTIVTIKEITDYH
jgi:proteic killer suppression protein